MLVVSNYIYAFILVLSLYLIGIKIYEKRGKMNIRKIIFFIWTALFIALALIIPSINFKALIIILIISIFYKLLFKETNRKSLLIAIFYYTSLVVSDCILSAINILYYSLFSNKEVILIDSSLIYSIITIIISYFIFTFIHNCTKDAIVSSSSKVANQNIFTFVFAFITGTCLLFFKIPSLDIKNIDIIINVTFLIIFIFIALIHIIKDILYAKDIFKDYQNTMKYIKDTEKLLEEYRFSIHENRNQLIMIRNMLNKKSDKKVLEYIDSIIAYKNDLDTLDSWTFKNLCNIPFVGLKEFIDYKFCEMKEENIEIETIINKEIRTLNEKILTTKDKEELYSVIGIIIDNAKEALIHSTNKYFSFQMFLVNDDINLVFANSYLSPVNTAKIFLSGFTNKGPKHGNGLAIAKKITSENSKFNLITEVLDEFFVQTLTIKTKNHHKTTKKHQT